MLMFIYVCVLTGVKWGDRWEAEGGGGDLVEEEEEGAMFVFLIGLLHFLVAFCPVMIHIYLKNKNPLLLGSSIKILFFMLWF